MSPGWASPGTRWRPLRTRPGACGPTPWHGRRSVAASGRFPTRFRSGLRLTERGCFSPWSRRPFRPLRFADPTGTHYFIDVEGENAFRANTDIFSELSRFAYPYSLVGGFNQGGIEDSAGTRLGSYQYFGPFEFTLFDAGRRAQPAVDLTEAALGAVRTAAYFWTPTALVAAGFGCVMEGACNKVSLLAALPGPNRLHHIFGFGKHNLDPLVARFGSQLAAFAAV
jgi:hypothetical protein